MNGSAFRTITAFIFFLLALSLSVMVYRKSFVARFPGSASDETPPMQTPYVGKLNFLALGDSYTIGESISPELRWPRQLAMRLRDSGIDLSDPAIIARTGWTTQDLLDAIDRAHITENFDLVTVLIGTNNQFQGRKQDEYREQFDTVLREAVAFARGKAGHVVVLSMPDWGVTPFGKSQSPAPDVSEQIDQFNSINREETRKAGARYVDVTGLSRGVTTRPDLLAEDGLHYSGSGYEQWVDACLPDAKRAVEAR